MNKQLLKYIIITAVILSLSTAVISPAYAWQGYLSKDNPVGQPDITHNDMARNAVYNMGVRDNNLLNVLENNAGEPDADSFDDQWDSHFYMTGDWYWFHVNIGRAPFEVQRFLSLACQKKNSNPAEAYKNLAYASHYMADMSQPYHVGVRPDLPTYYQRHSYYEAYAGTEQWNSGWTFKNSVNSMSTSTAWNLKNNDPVEMARWCGYGVDDYTLSIDNTILTNTNWQHDQGVADKTKASITQGSTYIGYMYAYMTCHNS